MRKGFVYLAAVLDWGTRKALSWGRYNSLTTDFSLVEAATRHHGPPEIFNTDQGNQFTSQEFVDPKNGRWAIRNPVRPGPVEG